MTNKEIIQVVAAFEAGEKIEVRPPWQYSWYPCPSPDWNFDFYEYRVAVKPLERWVNVYASGASDSFLSEAAAKQSAQYNNPIRVAVHLKEVV